LLSNPHIQKQLTQAAPKSGQREPTAVMKKTAGTAMLMITGILTSAQTAATTTNANPCLQQTCRKLLSQVAAMSGAKTRWDASKTIYGSAEAMTIGICKNAVPAAMIPRKNAIQQQPVIWQAIQDGKQKIRRRVTGLS